MRISLRQIMTLLLSTLLVLTVFSGCAQGGETSSAQPESPAASGEAPASAAESTPEAESSSQPEATGDKVSIMLPLWSPEVPSSDLAIWKKLNELTGAELDIQFVPSDSYNDKVNISIAASQLPESFVILQNKENTFVNAARSGMFWDVGEAIAAAPNLSTNLAEDVLYNASIDGANYYIPRTRITTRTAVNLRKDWLEAVGMAAPETMDELYEVLVAFRDKDPDGNGKDDTFGMIAAQADDTGLWGFNIAAVINGSGNNFVEQDGQIVPTFMTDPYIDTIKWFKKLYDEKLINQDFATIKQEKGFELMNAEQGGVFLGNSDEIINRFDPLLSAKQAETGNPDLTLEDLFVFVSHMKSDDGSIRIPGGTGFYGGFVFPKTTLKTEEEFQKVFQIFDVLDGEECKTLLKWGIEGENHELRDGTAYQINTDRFATDVTTFQQLNITATTIPSKLTGEEMPIRMKVDADQIANQQYAVMDPTTPFISETNTAKGTEIRKLYTDATIQWVMGEIDETGYQAAVDQWLAAGGQDIIDEMTEAWKATQ